ncbi:hypothetical protein OH77DRAFT_1493150 [Trametes cingulata]|nr:hypothetical protein OH77DRAFT_1493150 [Trametes cingulata]
MKLVVRVQYIGDRARILLREDQAPEYTKGLIDDLASFGFPVPHEQKPIEKSGFMLCVYYVERDSDMHRIIQNAFAKAKAEAAFLVERSIRYISLNEDGVMHTTNLSQKYKPPKTYNKPDYQSGPPHSYQNSSYKQNQQYGKAPKYPTTISQARHAASPLAQRMAVDSPGPSGQTLDYTDHEMSRHAAHSPLGGAAGGSDGTSSVIDVTQQTLLQLSQSSAFQSLLQKAAPAPTVPPVSIKSEPASPAELTMLLRQPVSSSTSTYNPSPQHPPQISNLQALLEKAGVKSSSAHALLQNSPPSLPQQQHSQQYHPSSSAAAMGTISPTTTHAPTAHHSIVGMKQESSSVGAGSSTGMNPPSRPPTTTPRVPTLRELWDIRREITALQARGRNVAADLRAAGQQIPLGPEDATPPSMAGGQSGGGVELLKMRELEAEVIALRQQLTSETNARKLAEATLRAERALRTEVEDVKRECREPFVVPALFDAFMKIGQMTGDGFQGQPPPAHSGPSGSTVPMEY